MGVGGGGALEAPGALIKTTTKKRLKPVSKYKFLE